MPRMAGIVIPEEKRETRPCRGADVGYRVRPDGREEVLAIGREFKVSRIQVGGFRLEDRLRHVAGPHQTNYGVRVNRLPSTQGEPACSD